METTCPQVLPSNLKFASNGIAAVLLLVLGLYLPTSVNAAFSKILLGLNFGLPVLVFVAFFFRAGNVTDFASCMRAALIVPLLLLFTGTSSLHEQAYGSIVLYGTLSFMLMLDLKNVVFPGWVENAFITASLVNIGAGIAIVAGIPSVDDFIIRHYTTSAIYAELVPAMLTLRKPVLTFGTHSLAGFILYLFFHVSWQAYVLRRRKRFLMIALGYLGLTAALLSWTGLSLALVGCLQIAFHVWRGLSHKWAWLYGLATATVVVAAFPGARTAAINLINTGQQSFTGLVMVGGGLAGRLLPGGTLYDDIRYIKAHPFSPTGFGNSAALMFVDSGWVEYTLRGSVILVILIYGCLFAFLRRSLRAKEDCYWLLLIILAFEVGFTSLTYYRTLALLPFFVIFLNSLRCTRDSTSLSSDAILRSGAASE